jgi:hypothetical protein
MDFLQSRFAHGVRIGVPRRALPRMNPKQLRANGGRNKKPIDSLLPTEDNRMKTMCIAAALIALAFVGGRTTARAQGKLNVPPGQQIVCQLHCHGLIFIRFADGRIIAVPEDTQGTATFQGAAARRGGDPTNGGCELTPVEINISGNDPVYGDYSFTFDATRSVTNSTVTPTDEAYAAGQDFPAIGDIYANVTGTIAGLQGTFTNTTECHMQATNLMSFNPHNNEVYTFVNDVVFTNGLPESEATQFTIPAGATVTLN